MNVVVITLTNLYIFQKWTVIGLTGQIGPIVQPVAARAARLDPERVPIHHQIQRGILAEAMITKSRIAEIQTRSVLRNVS